MGKLQHHAAEVPVVFWVVFILNSQYVSKLDNKSSLLAIKCHSKLINTKRIIYKELNCCLF